MDTSTLLTYNTVVSLLRPASSLVFISADDKRPWARQSLPALRHMFRGSTLDELWDCSLMRTFDVMSGSQPDNDDHRMLARSPRMCLDEEKMRTESLSKHADHTIWEDMPYISFTNCPQSLQELADWRATKNRGDQWIVVIDPRARFNLRLPILRYSEEMTYYSIKPPYKGDYWRNHYLCLWEVTPEEVVGVWCWNDLRLNPHWYEEIIMPAINEHRAERSYRADQSSQSSGDVETDSSDSSDSSGDRDDEAHGSDSDASLERADDDGWVGQVSNMCENLKLDWH